MVGFLSGHRLWNERRGGGSAALSIVASGRPREQRREAWTAAAAVPAARDPCPFRTSRSSGNISGMELSSRDREHGRVRGWQWFAVLAFGSCVLASIIALCLDLAGFVRGHELAVAQGWTGVLPGLALGVPGSLLLWRRPGNRVAVILLVMGVLWAIDGLASSWVNISLATPGGLPGTALAYWMFERFGAWLLVALQLVLVLFPEGRLPRGRWRVLALVSTIATSLLPLVLLVAPASALVESSDPI